MWDEIYDCRWLLIALVALLAFFAFAWVEGQKERAAFFAEHHCRDFAVGYACADGAVY